jgi:hypothetical protein
MMILLILVLMGLLFVAGFIVMTVIEEKRDETWLGRTPRGRRTRPRNSTSA